MIVLGICGLFILFIVQNVFPPIPGQTTTNQTNTLNQVNQSQSTQINSNLSSNFFSYENPDYNFKISYPEYMEVSESDLHPYQVVGFFIPVENIFQRPDVEIAIFATSGFPPNETVSDRVEKYGASINENTIGGQQKIISSNISKIGENEVYDVVSYDYSTDRTMKVNTIAILKEGEMYTIIYIAQPGLFNKYLQDFRHMVESMKIFRLDENSLVIKDIDNYANYFAIFTQDSANLTRAFQNEIGRWELGSTTNETMAKLTDVYLKKFSKQMNDFNQTESPAVFRETKNSMVSSLSNEIKSYEYVRDYISSGNETKNEISTEYLSKSIENEAQSFKSFNEVTNNTKP